MTRIRKSTLGIWVGVILAGSVFAVLLGTRLGIFSRPAPTAALPVGTAAARDSWMSVYQGREKIGYTHRRIAATPSGFQVEETAMMRINTMGAVQDVTMETAGHLNADQSLADFRFSLRAGRFSYRVSGRVVPGAMVMDLDGKKKRIAIKTPVYLSSGILDTVSAAGLKTGERRTFSVFDPSVMAARPVSVIARGMDTIALAQKTTAARKLEIEFMGVRQDAWVDAGGRILRETGPLGMTLTATDREGALTGISRHPDTDLTRLVAVGRSIRIPDRDSLRQLRLRIEGLPPQIHLAGGRQSVKNGILTITRETSDGAAGSPAEAPSAADLSPSPNIESDAPPIQRQARAIVKPSDSPLEKTRKLTDWVYRNLEKRPVVSVPDALETLRHRMGDCNEHAVLFAALARSVGLPTRIEAGLVLFNHQFYYHEWDAVYIHRWITVDSLMDQIPADVTHIRLVSGGLDRQMDLVGLIGKIDVQVLEPSQ